MRAGRVPAAALLFTIIGVFLLTTNAAEDLYWEGEEDSSNEFLEVKDSDESLIGSHIRRIRQLNIWDIFKSTSSTEEPPEELKNSDIDDTTDDTLDKEDEDSDQTFGSGASQYHVEPKEKTLRVVFIVNEPYQEQYSNRDSSQFQNLSRSLAEAVNLLYDTLPGTQRASLVRIQSRISDEFSCKVTLDVVTTGYEDTDRITHILHDHIRDRRKLGTFTVNDADFNAVVIDPDVGLSGLPDVPECGLSDRRCDNGQCVPNSARCNNIEDCVDGSDEKNCQLFTDNSNTIVDQCTEDELRCENGVCVAGDARCNGVRECDDGSDEFNCPSDPSIWDQDQYQETDTPPLSSTDRNEDTFNSQLTGCNETYVCSGGYQEICANKRCDGISDCPLNDDEDNCPKPKHKDCPDGFKPCDVTRCIAANKFCDGIPDCYDESDEHNCPDKSDTPLELGGIQKASTTSSGPVINSDPTSLEEVVIQEASATPSRPVVYGDLMANINSIWPNLPKDHTIIPLHREVWFTYVNISP